MAERTVADGFHLLEALMAWGGEIPPEDYEKVKANVVTKSEELGVPLLDALDVAVYTTARDTQRLVGARILQSPRVNPGVNAADIDVLLDR